MEDQAAVRLNEANIRRIKAPSKGYKLIRDDEITGLGLRVTANDARSFVLTYTIDGRQRRLTIGPWPEWTGTAARERAKDLRRQVDQGEDPLGTKQARRVAPTVEDIAKAYLDRHASKKKSGHILKQYIERDILPQWKNLKAADIRRRDVQELVELKAQSAPIAANMLLSVISGLYNWAIEKDYDLEINPASRVRPPGEKTARDRWLTQQEIRDVWTKLDTAKMAPECRAALRLMLVTAQRSGEVLSIENSEADTETALWTIPATKAKNGMQHTVPLSSLAIEQLPTRHEKWLFPSWYTDRHMTVAGLSNAVAENREHFGIPHWTPHDLRRTAATHMGRIGVNRFTISRILNHADKTVTAIYERHSYEAEKRAALDKWDRELRRILEIPARSGNVVAMSR